MTPFIVFPCYIALTLLVVLQLQLLSSKIGHASVVYCFWRSFVTQLHARKKLLQFCESQINCERKRIVKTVEFVAVRVVYHWHSCMRLICLLQFKIAIVVMGRPKYLPDDGDHVLNLDDFQPPHWQGRSRSFDGSYWNSQ